MFDPPSDRCEGADRRPIVSSSPHILGLILAGGQARRMGGGDKTTLAIGGRPIVSRIHARLAPQCAAVVLNTNGDPARFEFTGLPVATDSIVGFAGPLAGVLAGMDWAALHAPAIDTLLTVPGDCPFLPRDLVARLQAARQTCGAPIAYAQSGGRRHPVIALWPVSLRDVLRQAVQTEGQRKVEDWMIRHGAMCAVWESEPVDPFFNVNTPTDAAEAERLAHLFPEA